MDEVKERDEERPVGKVEEEEDRPGAYEVAQRREIAQRLDVAKRGALALDRQLEEARPAGDVEARGDPVRIERAHGFQNPQDEQRQHRDNGNVGERVHARRGDHPVVDLQHVERHHEKQEIDHGREYPDFHDRPLQEKPVLQPFHMAFPVFLRLLGEGRARGRPKFR